MQKRSCSSFLELISGCSGCLVFSQLSMKLLVNTIVFHPKIHTFALPRKKGGMRANKGFLNVFYFLKMVAHAVG
jgi:hypothetical protein